MTTPRSDRFTDIELRDLLRSVLIAIHDGAPLSPETEDRIDTVVHERPD